MLKHLDLVDDAGFWVAGEPFGIKDFAFEVYYHAVGTMGYCHAVLEIFAVMLIGVSIFGVDIYDDIAVDKEMYVAGRRELLVIPVEGQLGIQLDAVACLLCQINEVFGVDGCPHSEVEGVVDVHSDA